MHCLEGPQSPCHEHCIELSLYIWPPFFTLVSMVYVWAAVVSEVMVLRCYTDLTHQRVRDHMECIWLYNEKLRVLSRWNLLRVAECLRITTMPNVPQ